MMTTFLFSLNTRRDSRRGGTGSASILAFGGDPVLARYAILPLLHLRADLHPGLPDVHPGLQIRLSQSRGRLCSADAQIRVRLAGPDAMRQVPQLRRSSESLHGRPQWYFASADDRSSAVSASAASARSDRAAAG